jgi:hypothetical protein
LIQNYLNELTEWWVENGLLILRRTLIFRFFKSTLVLQNSEIYWKMIHLCWVSWSLKERFATQRSRAFKLQQIMHPHNFVSTQNTSIAFSNNFYWHMHKCESLYNKIYLKVDMNRDWLKNIIYK